MNLKSVLNIAGRSDPGRVRSHNEDFIGNDPEIGLVILADGMGGYKGGEIASEMAVNTVLEDLKSVIPALNPGEIDEQTGYSRESLAARQSIIKANEAIHTIAQKQPQYHGMGTTVVLGIFYDNHITIAHVGDSRMYRFREDRLEQVTVDHTLLQELIDRGFYSPEEARESLNKNLVTRALGIEDSVAVDIHEDLVLPGDIYLLCSDGLNDMMEDEVMSQIIRNSKDNLERIADQLIMQANENGGKDNVSVILATPQKTFPNSKKHFHRKIMDWLF